MDVIKTTYPENVNHGTEGRQGGQTYFITQIFSHIPINKIRATRNNGK
jgi:hypothetical protein